MTTDAYYTDQQCLMKNGKEGAVQLTNFVARITGEKIYHDGQKTTTYLTIDGILHNPEVDDEGEPVWPDGEPLPEITIAATDFATLSWVPERWGMRPIIYPTPSAERETRTAIQIASKPTKEHIYTHTGWDNIKGQQTYLTSNGGINRDGLDRDISVQLPDQLAHYSLPKPAADKSAFRESLRLVNLGPPAVMWPLLLATYRAAIGPSDFAVHVAGRTGTYKSEVASLFQSHYGEGMDARHLPASWSSTTNAIEALAYKAAHALMVLDDFVPLGTAYQVRQLQATADRVIRGAGNQAGRARLTDTSNMQQTYFPRCLVLSTGEDVPEGHSVRGRMLIVEMPPNAIELVKLSVAQLNRALYSQAMADWIHWLAQEDRRPTFKERSRQIRDQHNGVGHSRTPNIIGDLMATMEMLCEYAIEQKWFSSNQMAEICTKAGDAIKEAANSQKTFLTASDPTEAIFDTLRMMMGSMLAHAKTPNGGIPADAERYGWTQQQVPGDMPTYKSNGPRIGWVNAADGEFLLDPNCLTLLKKYSGGKLAVTQQTLLKRMKEGGKLMRTDEQRQRNTVRQKLEGHPKQVLALSLEEVLSDDGV